MQNPWVDVGRLLVLPRKALPSHPLNVLSLRFFADSGSFSRRLKLMYHGQSARVPLAGHLNCLPTPPLPHASVSPQKSKLGGDTLSLVGREWGSQLRRRDRHLWYSVLCSIPIPCQYCNIVPFLLQKYDLSVLRTPKNFS